jgi:hypothetical protein
MIFSLVFFSLSALKDGPIEKLYLNLNSLINAETFQN